MHKWLQPLCYLGLAKQPQVISLIKSYKKILEPQLVSGLGTHGPMVDDGAVDRSLCLKFPFASHTNGDSQLPHTLSQGPAVILLIAIRPTHPEARQGVQRAWPLALTWSTSAQGRG